MKYYTGKEIQKRTGLTRKHLMLFKEVIKPVERTKDFIINNPQYKGYNEKYKIYDQEAMDKLVKASILIKLGQKPRDVIDFFSTEFDESKVLDDVIKTSQEKIEELTNILKTARIYRNTNISIQSNLGYDLLEFKSATRIENESLLLSEEAKQEELALNEAMKSESNMDILDEFLSRLGECINGSDISWHLIETVNGILDEMVDFSEDVLGVSWGYFFTSQVMELTRDGEYKDMVDNIICDSAGTASSIAGYIECYQWDMLISNIRPELEKCTKLLNSSFSSRKLDPIIEIVLNELAYCFGEYFRDIHNASILIILSADPSTYFEKKNEIRYLLDAILYRAKMDN